MEILDLIDVKLNQLNLTMVEKKRARLVKESQEKYQFYLSKNFSELKSAKMLTEWIIIRINQILEITKICTATALDLIDDELLITSKTMSSDMKLSLAQTALEKYKLHLRLGKTPIKAATRMETWIINRIEKY